MDPEGGAAQRYLVNEQGVPVYLVDPGINGTHRVRPDGSAVQKFDAPKATLMSYIIKGILSHKLPWALVLLGAMIAVVLEMSGIPSLAFAVGVYLPLASSSPIFIGGMVRWLVDRYLKVKFRPQKPIRDGTHRGGRQESWRFARFGLHRRRRNHRDCDRCKRNGGSACRDWASDRGMANSSQSVSKRPVRGSTALIPFFIICLLLYLVGRDLLLVARSKKLSSKSAQRRSARFAQTRAAVFPIRISPLAKFGARLRSCRLPLHRPRQCGDPRFLG